MSGSSEHGHGKHPARPANLALAIAMLQDWLISDSGTTGTPADAMDLLRKRRTVSAHNGIGN
jgi:hypothetical protein